MITQELLQRLFEYKEGNLIRKVKTGTTTQVGDIAGTILNTGYRSICVKGKQQLAHRLIFLYHHGYLPKYIDHINNDRLDNRIENLRECTNQQNGFNSNRGRGKSRYKGVAWSKGSRKWRAYINNHYKQLHLGLFTCEHEAAKAYNKKARELYGEFAKLNEIIND